MTENGEALAQINRTITELLLAGRAHTASEAEEIYLDTHLEEVLKLVSSPLPDEEFRSHPLIQLLFSHGSRSWEDALG